MIVTIKEIKELYMKNYLILLMVVSLVSCSNSKRTKNSFNELPKEQVELKDEAYFKKNGFEKAIVVDESKIDGCAYMIHIEGSDKILFPIKLDPDYKQDGLNIWVKYRPVKPMMTTCMRGILVAIEEIEVRN